jgi:squalene synthase HpnC
MLDEGSLSNRARSENFTVASRLLPAKVRDHLLAFYSYARLVDEIGDSYQGDRLAALDALEVQVHQALDRLDRAHVLPVVTRVAGSVRELATDPAPLFDLIAANRMDQTVTSYQSFADLLDYCRLSANPVGRLVLAAFRAISPERIAWSDSICTGLQLAEHWQDVAEDAEAGRVYIPEDDLDRFGVDRRELAAGPPSSRALRALMIFEVARARRLLDDGKELIFTLSGSARWAVAGFWAGGQSALDAIARRNFEVLAGTPRASKPRTAVRAIAVLTRPPTRREAA